MSKMIYLSLAALIYTFLIAIVFFTKKKMPTIENKIYTSIIWLTLISLFSELIIVPFTNLNQDALLFGTMKIYLICCLTWVSIFTIYSYVVSHKQVDKEFVIAKKEKKLLNVFIVFYVVCFILIMILPIHFFNEPNMKYSYGPSVNVVFTVCGLLMFIMVYFLLRNFKNLRRKGYYPIIAFVILLMISSLIQKINPSFLVINFIFGFITTLMYHTIENPDIQMVEELLVNREIVEKTMEDKSNLLFKITAEVKKPAHDILEKANEYKILTKKAEKEYIVEEIEQNAKDLLFVVNDILDVSSLTSSNIKMIDNLYFPHNLLLGLKIKQLKDMPENVKLDFSIASTIPEKLYGDSIKLKQIINSLICNAKQFTKEGLIEVDVSTIIKYDICRLIINVSDTGTGMSIKEINSILESQDKLTKEEKKSINENDVSLKAIVKIVRLLNGSINIKSTENKGTIVTVILDQMIVRDKQKQEISYDIQDFGRKRVMYIHKYTNNSVKLDKKLKDSSTNIVSVLFANQAVEMLNNKEKYNLIVVSDELPALETLKEIKTVKHINIPIIVLVGNGNEFLSKHYLKDGFDDIMLENDIDNEVKRIKDKYL